MYKNVLVGLVGLSLGFIISACDQCDCEDDDLDPVIGSWNCIAEDGNEGFLVFSENGNFSKTGVYISSGDESHWARADEGIYIISGNVDDVSEITFSDNNTSMHVVPDDDMMDTLDCTRP